MLARANCKSRLVQLHLVPVPEGALKLSDFLGCASTILLSRFKFRDLALKFASAVPLCCIVAFLAYKGIFVCSHQIGLES